MRNVRSLYRFVSSVDRLFYLSAVAVVHAQEESGDIQKMMSPEEFKAAG